MSTHFSYMINTTGGRPSPPSNDNANNHETTTPMMGSLDPKPEQKGGR